MYIDAVYDLTKETLKSIGEYNTAYVLLVVATMVAVSNMEDIYEEHEGNSQDVYGFNGVTYNDIMKFRNTLLSPDKNSASKLSSHSKVDLWNDSESIIRLHAAGNLVFQILLTYFHYKMKDVKIQMRKETIMDIISTKWINDFLPFDKEAVSWLDSKLAE